jgi:hypothetical protein
MSGALLSTTPDIKWSLAIGAILSAKAYEAYHFRVRAQIRKPAAECEKATPPAGLA